MLLKEKDKEEEGQEASYNSLTPDHTPLAANTGIYNIYEIYYIYYIYNIKYTIYNIEHRI